MDWGDEVRYGVARESAFTLYRWPWQARRAFKRADLLPEECVLLVKYQRNGRVKCIDERRGA